MKQNNSYNISKNKNILKEKYLFIDLDHTITNKDAFVIITEYLFETKNFNYKYWPMSIILLVLHNFTTLFFPKKFVKGFILYKNIPASTVTAAIKNCKKELISAIYPKANEFIKSFKKKGYKIILVTGTFEEVGKLIAKHLKLDRSIGTILESKIKKDKKILTGQTINGTLRGKEKANEIKKQFSKEILQNSVIVSDSIVDLPFLELSNNPIAANPDKHLLKVAKKRRWKILNFKNKD